MPHGTKDQIREQRKRYKSKHRNRLRKYERRRAYRRAKELRAEWISRNGPCKCGSTDRLQVDHVDPKLKDPKLKAHARGTSALWTWGKDKREKELLTCQVLCFNCHVEKSTLEQRRLPLHGRAGYWRGCRCDICRSGKQEYKKQLRLKRDSSTQG